jgi:hypothetical protein
VISIRLKKRSEKMMIEEAVPRKRINSLVLMRPLIGNLSAL